jgi:hypothetical protein
MVGLDDQLVRDQFNRHHCVLRENLVEPGCYGPQVIDDDDSNAHIGGQIP